MNSVYGNSPTPFEMLHGAMAPNLTPSGMIQGAELSLPPPSWMLSTRFEGMPMWWPSFLLPCFTPVKFPATQSLMVKESTSAVTPELSLSNSPQESVAHHEKEDADKLSLQIKAQSKTSYLICLLSHQAHKTLQTRCTSF